MLLRTLLGTLALLATSGCLEAEAQITFGGVTDEDSTNSPRTTATFSHEVGTAGAETLLVVCVYNSSGGSVIVPSGVTYNGAALTKYVQAASGAPGAYATSLWYRAGIPAGTADVVVTMPSSQITIAKAFSFYGVNQTTPLEASNSNTGSFGTPSVAVTTVTDGAWAIDCTQAGNPVASPSAGSGQTARGAVLDKLTLSKAVASTEPVATAGSTTMDWSGFTSVAHSEVAVSIKPASFDGTVIYADGSVTSVVGPGFAIFGSPDPNEHLRLPARDDVAVTRNATESLANKTLAAPIIVDPIVSGDFAGDAFLDEDDLASDSATKVASQQSTKAYVDTAIGNVAFMLAAGDDTFNQNAAYGCAATKDGGGTSLANAPVCIAPFDLTIDRLYASSDGGSMSAGDAVKIELWTGSGAGTASGLTCTFADAGPYSCSDLVHSVNISQGTRFGWVVTETGTVSAAVGWSARVQQQ